MREVTHMDVIANARAVRGWIVIAENLNVGPLMGRRLKNNGNQVRLRIVLLATQRRCACGVEIAETHVAQAVGLLVPMADTFQSELRLPIRICGTRGVRLFNKRLLRITVYGSCRGKYQPGNSCGTHSLEQCDAGYQIVGIVFCGVAARLSD